jgi:ubiquitin-conjugating enzyme E2 S
LSIPSTSSTRKSPAPPSQPLQSSPANTLPTSVSSVSSDKDNKERITSPSPLGTANANVGGGVGVMGPAPPNTTKAVKRPATSVGSTGAEKRKKALKRL